MILKIGLNSKDIADAIQKVNDYKNNLNNKVQELVDRLGEVGLNVVQDVMSSVPEETGDWHSAMVEPISGDGRIGCAIKLTGNKVLFIEFSAGIRYGTSEYPLPSGSGFGMGTYPSDKGHWDDPRGWWYPDPMSPTGYTHTYGNRAYMPMYHAVEAIMMEVGRIASEVFSFE